tara:strand:- start:2215 stop:3180 length:966 start_codon:yes stop_codon:yes gene_type:complete
MKNKNIIKDGKKVLDIEIQGIKKLYKSIDSNFEKAVKKLSKVKGRVIITGVGKSGHIAAKISSSMSSTGTPSQSVSPTDLSHGDLGIIRKNDALIVISNSGNSSELTKIIDFAKKHSITFIGISQNPKGKLLKASNIPLLIPKSKEACSVGKAPTTSTSQALVLGDSLCVALMKLKKFKIEDYKRIHPSGSLGLSMLQVKDIMHTGSKMPIVKETSKMKTSIIEMSRKSFGVVGVKNSKGSLIGIITDGDLRRNINKNFLKFNAKEMMTHGPKLIDADELMLNALKIMTKNKITCLFVTKKQLKTKPVGIIHIHDCLRFVN